MEDYDTLTNAVLRENLSEVQQLVEAGEGSASLALEYACTTGNAPIVNYLLQYADPYFGCVCSAAMNGHLAITQTIWNLIDHDTVTQYELDNTMHYAASHRHSEVCMFLLTIGANPEAGFDSACLTGNWALALTFLSKCSIRAAVYELAFLNVCSYGTFEIAANMLEYRPENCDILMGLGAALISLVYVNDDSDEQNRIAIELIKRGAHFDPEHYDGNLSPELRKCMLESRQVHASIIHSDEIRELYAAGMSADWFANHFDELTLESQNECEFIAEIRELTETRRRAVRMLVCRNNVGFDISNLVHEFLGLPQI